MIFRIICNLICNKKRRKKEIVHILYRVSNNNEKKEKKIRKLKPQTHTQLSE